MENPPAVPEPVAPEPKPQELPNVRVPEPLPASEKETLEGKIKDQAEEIRELKKKANPPKNKLTILQRFSPLG